MANEWLVIQGNSAGGGGGYAGTGFTPLTIAANAVTPDIALANNFLLTLNQAAQVTINNPIFTGGTIIPGMEITIWIYQDGTGGRPSPAWGSIFQYNFAPPTIAGDAGTYSVAVLMYDIGGVWRPKVPFATLNF